MVDVEELYEQVELKHLYKLKGAVQFIEEDAQLSINVAFYQELLDIKGYSIKLWQWAGSHKKLKELSQWAQKNGPRIDGWQLLVNVETLYGWRPAELPIGERVKEWVSNVFVPKYDGSEELFNFHFRQAVREVLDWKTESLDVPMTLDEFCNNIVIQGTAGSAYDPGGVRLECEYDGVKVKPTNNKFSKSMALSSEQKKKRLLSFKKQKCRVSTKIEFYPKERLIVSADYDTTEKMRFVDTWLQKWMDGNPLSTLWQTSEGRLAMWKLFSKQNKKMWNCPIDQSAFDHHVSKMMVKIVLQEIKELIIRRATGNKNELVEVMERVEFALDGGEVLYEERDGSKHKIEYKNGVLSGWQWTAFIDTVCNIAESIMAKKLLKNKGVELVEGEFNAQGDDQLEQFKTPVMCIAYWAAMTSFGLDLNLSKNFFSNIHNEYLRKCAYNGAVNGYPARLVESILWVYPGQRMSHDKLERMKNIVSNWTRMTERLNLNFKKLLAYVRKDCKGGKIKNEDLETYLFTAKVNGGSGLLGTETTQKLIKESNKIKKVKINGKGLHEFQLRFGEYQTRELDSWAQSVIGLPNKIKKDGVEIDLEEEGDTTIVKSQELKEIPIMIATNQMIHMLKHKDGWTNALVFGSSKELAEEVFPGFETYASFKHAPRKWIFEMLTSKLKVNVPRLTGMSEEFSSLIFEPYKNSVISAMVQKQTRDHNKWDRIQLYVERNFESLIDISALPSMMG